MATRDSTGFDGQRSSHALAGSTGEPLQVEHAAVVRGRIELAMSGELAIGRADLAAGEVIRLNDPRVLRTSSRESPVPVLVDMRDCVRGVEHRIAGVLLVTTLAAAANDGAVAIVGGPLCDVTRSLHHLGSVNARWFASANDGRRWLRSWMIEQAGR